MVLLLVVCDFAWAYREIATSLRLLAAEGDRSQPFDRLAAGR
jgi:hypothetical protein